MRDFGDDAEAIDGHDDFFDGVDDFSDDDGVRHRLERRRARHNKRRADEPLTSPSIARIFEEKSRTTMMMGWSRRPRP